MLCARWSLTLVVILILLLMVVPALAAPLFSSWGLAANLEWVPGTSSELNTMYMEGCPILSRDGLRLYFASTRPGGLGGIDIWFAERASPDEPFGDPANIGAPINSASNDFCPSPLRNGHGFMFVSNRPEGCGGTDIYLTRYYPEGGWQAPENLGCGVNSPADEAGPVVVFAEPGSPTLYFSSARVGGPQGVNLYISQMVGNWSFGPAKLIPGVNSDADDIQPYVRQDGRELVFASNRPGGIGNLDLWSASRNLINDSWSAPVNLGENVNSAANDTRPSLSWDGTTLFFGTTRVGGIEGVSDIFYATRYQLPNP